jgi:hypothetical protein
MFLYQIFLINKRIIMNFGNMGNKSLKESNKVNKNKQQQQNFSSSNNYN